MYECTKRHNACRSYHDDGFSDAVFCNIYATYSVILARLDGLKKRIKKNMCLKMVA